MEHSTSKKGDNDREIPNDSNSTSSSSVKNSLTRILERRSKDCELLGDDIVSKIVEGPWKNNLYPRLPNGVVSPKERFLRLLKDLFHVASNEKEGVDASARRSAYESAIQLLEEMDSQVQKKKSLRNNAASHRDQRAPPEIAIPSSKKTAAPADASSSQTGVAVASLSTTQDPKQAVWESSAESGQETAASDSQKRPQVRTQKGERQPVDRPVASSRWGDKSPAKKQPADQHFEYASLAGNRESPPSNKGTTGKAHGSSPSNGAGRKNESNRGSPVKSSPGIGRDIVAPQLNHRWNAPPPSVHSPSAEKLSLSGKPLNQSHSDAGQQKAASDGTTTTQDGSQKLRGWGQPFSRSFSDVGQRQVSAPELPVQNRASSWGAAESAGDRSPPSRRARSSSPNYRHSSTSRLHESWQRESTSPSSHHSAPVTRDSHSGESNSRSATNALRQRRITTVSSGPRKPSPRTQEKASKTNRSKMVGQQTLTSVRDSGKSSGQTTRSRNSADTSVTETLGDGVVPSQKSPASKPSQPRVQGRSAKVLQRREGPIHKFVSELKSNTSTAAHVTIQPDLERPKQSMFACTVKPRPERLRISFKWSAFPESLATDMDSRLTRWDPFWKPIEYIAMERTAPITRCQPAEHEAAKTATCIVLHPKAGKIAYGGQIYRGVANIQGLSWGQARTAYEDGDLAILLRVLPTTLLAKKRADCHLWPKGTFLQIQGKPIDIVQRRQQKHDESEWKGLSKPINVCEYIRGPGDSSTIEMCCLDDKVYACCLTLCHYQTPAAMFNELTGSGPGALPTLPPEESRDLAASFAQQQTVSLVDSGDEEEEEIAKFAFSLSCPISKQIMETPVRSPLCKHWQCFDLKNYLLSNQRESGSRWRCSSCERFVPLSELQICGLTSDLLKEFKGVATPQRDRVEYCADSTYKLLAVRKRRSRAAAATNNDPKRKKPNEVISL